VLSGRAQARPLVSGIITMRSIEHIGEAHPLCQRDECGIEIGLAVIASGGVISYEPIVAKLVRVVKDLMHADLRARLPRQCEFHRRECCRHGGDRRGAIPQDVVRRLQHQRAVDAAREGDEGGVHAPH